MTAGWARLEIALATALFSTGGAAIKYCSLTPWQIASYRSAIGALALLFLLPAARRGFGAGPLLVGASQAATMIFFVVANKWTTAAATIFLQSTAPLYVLALGPLVLRERPSRADLVFMAALAVGLLFLLAGEQAPLASAPDPAAGNVVALFGGMTWALTVVGLRGLGRDGEVGAPQASIVAGNLIAFVLCLPAALAAGNGVGAVDLGVLVALGVLQIALPYALLTRALRALPAFEASLLLLLEPVLNPLWAWLLQGEEPGAGTLAGGAVILLATLLRSIAGR